MISHRRLIILIRAFSIRGRKQLQDRLLEKGLTNIVLFFIHALPSAKWPTILGEKAALGFAVFVSGEVLPREK